MRGQVIASRMKLDAHPMVVAVALGLLGPGVLFEEDDEESCATCGHDPADPVAESWEPGPAPDPEEFHRVALLWDSLASPDKDLEI